MSIKKLNFTGSSKIIRNLVNAVNALIDQGGGGGIEGEGAGFHNSIYRGKNLGSALTADHWAAIKAGTFDDLFIGDYVLSGGVNWRIAAFDYWLNSGRTGYFTTDHHVVMMPDTGLYQARMTANMDYASQSSGYYGSEMRSTNLNAAKTTINNVFGSTHILTYRDFLTTSVTSGQADDNSMKICTVEIPSSCMILGRNQYSTDFESQGCVGQLPLFRLRPDLIFNGQTWWLRDYSKGFGVGVATVGGDYSQIYNSAGTATAVYVRPVFAIYQA